MLENLNYNYCVDPDGPQLIVRIKTAIITAVAKFEGGGDFLALVDELNSIELPPTEFGDRVVDDLREIVRRAKKISGERIRF